uniref:Class I SAM-dependent methyltransferase n=1 Tax=candidate division WOR-3 bacterium TaxID=2052148 RepID=A0A7V4E601_UNCW3
MEKKYNVGKIFPPGHFYSPIPDLDEISKREEKIFRRKQDEEVLGFDLNVSVQLEHLRVIEKFVKEFDFPTNPVKHRFYLNNGFFEGLDAFAYFSFILHYKPKKVIEIGCGFSSLLLMEVNKKFFNNNIDIKLIEPYPSKDLVEGLRVFKNAELLQVPVQDLDFSIFEELNENDILFIDSTHVAKVGSDVNYIFFEILPRLNYGVLIHFHDIFLPDEYPKKWVFEENRAWNEMYILRAFLMYNNCFKTLFSSYYVSTRFPEMVIRLFNKPTGGGSYWLKKIC